MEFDDFELEVVADLSLWDLIGRLHPAAVHMPIAITFLFLLHEIAVYFKLKGFKETAPYYMLATVLSYLPAVATGWIRAGEFESESLVDIYTHRNYMLLSYLILVILTSWRMFSNKIKGWYLIGLLIVCIVMAYSADLGGKLVYGEDYFG